MDYKFLNKVIDQILSETIVDNRYSGHEIWVSRNISVPFSHNPISFQSFLPGPLTTSRFYKRDRLPPLYTLFEQHCKVVYGLNDDEVDYLWDEYKNIIKDKIEHNKNTITESEEITVKDSIFLRKMIKYLKDNTKVVIEPFDIYDGYIIAPIGNGFRWDFYNKTIQPHGDFANEWWKEMLEVYGLSSKEVLIVMGIYQDFIWETLEKISDGR